MRVHVDDILLQQGPALLFAFQVKAPQNQSSQAHQQGQAAVQPGSQPPSSEETGVDLMPQNEEEVSIIVVIITASMWLRL